MRLYRHLLIIAVALLVTSCSSYKDIRVENVSNVTLREFRGSTAVVDLTLLVDNPTGSSVNLKEVNLDVNRKDSKFAHISSANKVHVPAKSRLEQNLTLEIRLTNPLASGFLLLGKKLNYEEFTASGYIKVSSFPFSKKIRFKDEKMDKLLKGLESLTRKNVSDK